MYVQEGGCVFRGSVVRPPLVLFLYMGAQESLHLVGARSDPAVDPSFRWLSILIHGHRQQAHDCRVAEYGLRSPQPRQSIWLVIDVRVLDNHRKERDL